MKKKGAKLLIWNVVVEGSIATFYQHKTPRTSRVPLIVSTLLPFKTAYETILFCHFSHYVGRKRPPKGSQDMRSNTQLTIGRTNRI